jgi:DNA-binding protein HU-beta
MATKKSTRKKAASRKAPVQTPAQKGAQTRAKNRQLAARAAAEKQLRRLAKARQKRQERARAKVAPISKQVVKLGKNVKAVTKQGKKSTKNIKQNVKAVTKAVTKIKEIFKPKKKAAKKAVKKVAAPKGPKKLSRATLEEILDPENYFTYDDFVQMLLENAEQINASLNKGERFVATYYFGKTKKSYPTIQGLISRLNDYDATKRYHSNDGELGRELIESIQIHRIKSDRSYVAANKKRLAEIEKQKDVIIGGAREVRGTTKKTGQKKKVWELLGESEEENKKLKAEIERLKKRGK